jgi:lipoyl(octanoyl) transferase
MSRDTIFEDLKIIDYKEAWDYQESIFQKMLAYKAEKLQPNPHNFLLFCEHPHVFTIGKSGSEEHLLISNAGLREQGISFYRTNRGGEITYHGYGQITGYPILDLENFQIGLKEYIQKLEEVMILTLKAYHIEAGRLKNAAGVWVEEHRKVCAIGVRASRMITMHGFAFNVNTDLDYFKYINPCGFTDKNVTSMEKELGKKVDFEEVKACLKEKFVQVFEMNLG